MEGAALDILSAINTFVAGRKDKGFVAKHSKKVIMLLNWTFVMAGVILYEDIFANEAYGSAIGNTLAIISLLIAIYRYDIKPGIKKQG